MTAVEIMVWSLALGAIGAVTLVRLVDLATRPSVSHAQSTGFHFTVLVFVALLSGLVELLEPAPDPELLEAAQVVAGPLCVGLSAFWIVGWLNARHREKLMARTLRLAALLTPVASLATFLLPANFQLPAAGALSLLTASLTLWLIWRTSLMGDPLAPVMALGCLLTLPAIAGLYATAMQIPAVTLAWQGAFAVCAAVANGLTGYALWRRDAHDWGVRHEPAACGVRWKWEPATASASRSSRTSVWASSTSPARSRILTTSCSWPSGWPKPHAGCHRARRCWIPQPAPSCRSKKRNSAPAGPGMRCVPQVASAQCGAENHRRRGPSTLRDCPAPTSPCVVTG